MHPAVVLGRRVGEDTVRDVDDLYVATPEVLALLDLENTPLQPGIEVLTPFDGRLAYANTRSNAQPAVQHIDTAAYSSTPSSLITEAGLQKHGWQTRRSGWLLEAAQPITAEHRASLRDHAAAAGLTVEFRDPQNALGTIRLAATVVGVLVALGVIGLTLGLLRVETNNDLRTLTATGAPRSVRRSLSAATGASLATTGTLLGVGLAYAGLIAAYASNLDPLLRVPVAHISVLVAGVPALAAAASWLVAGKEPPMLRRAPIE